jgi:YHS domain-containing protein
MFKNLKAALLAACTVMVFGLFASMGFAHEGAPGNAKTAVAVGNKICPVTGEKIDENSEVRYEYKGKVYSFCCRACVLEFKKDPAKYIEEMKKAAANSQERSAHPDHH